MRTITPRHRPDEGFTLIELLVVIVIMGILAGIVVFSVKGLNNHGDLAACKTEVNTVETAEEADYANNGTYGTIADLETAGLLHSGMTPKYVASASATDGSLTLVASPPAGCTAN